MKFETLIRKLRAGRKPLLAVLVDPDKYNPVLVHLCNEHRVSCFLVGGSVIERGNIAKTVSAIKKISEIPIVLFPGDEHQLTKAADGVFLPALISGRNPDYLIGKQVLMAPLIRKMKLAHASMAYMLVGGENQSATQRVTGTSPMKQSDVAIIRHTAIAAEQLGFSVVYLEAGSGAGEPVNAEVIRAVKNAISLPVIVGGGIDSAARARSAIKAGANMVVVGNALEKNVLLLPELHTAF